MVTDATDQDPGQPSEEDETETFQLASAPWRRRRRRRYLHCMGRTEKRCPRCGQTKPASEFHKWSHSNDGLSNYCAPCQSAYFINNHHRYFKHRWPKVLLKAARWSSKVRGLEFALTVEDVLELHEEQGGLCYWFGIPLIADALKRNPQKPSLDRLDCSRGYVKGNVVLACHVANLGRSNCDVETFQRFCDLLRGKVDGPSC